MTMLRAGLLGAVAVLIVATPVQAAMPIIAPHRAVYDLELDRSTGDPSSGDIQGRLVLETTGTACEGYTVNTRFVTRISSGKGNVVSDLRSTTWEAGDGSSYRFLTRNFLGKKLQDETDGAANRDDGKVTVELRQPEEATFAMNSEVLFPTQHVLRLLEAAEAGEQIVVADVFDGSETGRKTFSTTAVIGARRAPEGATDSVGGEVLGTLASWPVTVGYFDNDAEQKDIPTYEFSYDLFSNGVSRKIVLDFGEFTLVGDLTNVEFLQIAPCEQ